MRGKRICENEICARFSIFATIYAKINFEIPKEYLRENYLDNVLIECQSGCIIKNFNYKKIKKILGQKQFSVQKKCWW